MTDTSKFVFDDITLKEVLGNALIKWRRIICLSLILALLLFAVKLAINIFAYKEKAENVSELESKAETILKEIEADEKNLEAYEDYMRNALYLNLNASLVHRGAVTYSIISSVANTETDYAGNVAAAYRASVKTGELSSFISDKINTKKEYLDQVFSFDYDAELNPYQISIICYSSSESQATLMKEYVKEFFTLKDKEYINQFGDYEAIIVSEDNSVVSLQDVNVAKTAADTSLVKFEDEIKEKKSEYRDCVSMTNVKDVIINAFVVGVCAFVVFMIVAFAYYFVIILASNKVKSENQLKYNYGFNVLGSIGLPNYKTKLDKLAYKWAGINVNDYDNYFKVLDKKIEIISNSKEAIIVPINDADYSEAKSFKSKVLSSSLEKSNSLDEIAKAEDIVLIVKRFSTTIEKVEDAVYILESYGKHFVGIILI